MFSRVLCVLLWVLWVLPLGENVPHIAFVCVWAKCVFSKVLRVPLWVLWVLPLGEKVPHIPFACGGVQAGPPSVGAHPSFVPNVVIVVFWCFLLFVCGVSLGERI